MLSILIKYFIYEKAINILFERIELNFSAVQLMPTEGQHIDISYFLKNDRYKKMVTDATVHKTNTHYIIILHQDWAKVETDINDIKTPIVQFRLDVIFKEDIISWTPTNYITRFGISKF